MKKNTILMLLIFVIVGALIFSLPDIYNKVQELTAPKVDVIDIKKEKEKQKEVITIDSDLVQKLTYPIMRNNKYSMDTYYSLDEFTMDNLSNNDILYNAFLDIYTGYFVNHGSVGCTSNSKEFDASYMIARIKNIIGKDIDYTLEDFTVPNINRDTDYIGTWKYDGDKFIYYGNCNKENSGTMYYDLSKLYKVNTSKDNNALFLYHYVGFVKVDGNKYIIYSDYNMTNEVTNGTISDTSELDDIFNNLDMSNFRTYKYTFKKGLCSYDNYCFYKGEWINVR